jgi:nucleoside 2-deoxyribosyltransferase
MIGSCEEIEKVAHEKGYDVKWVPNPRYLAPRGMKVYLAGPITGLTYGAGQDWRQYVSQRFTPGIVGYSPLRAKQYLDDGNVIRDNQEEVTMHGDLSAALSSDKGIVARDRYDCKTADLILMNLLGATRVSIGTMVEIGWATAYDKPVVLVMESEGNIHDHMMVRTLPFIVRDLDSAVKVVNAILLQ